MLLVEPTVVDELPLFELLPGAVDVALSVIVVFFFAGFAGVVDGSVVLGMFL